MVEKITEAFISSNGKIYASIHDAEEADMYNEVEKIYLDEIGGYMGLDFDQLKSILPKLYQVLDKYKHLIKY